MTSFIAKLAIRRIKTLNRNLSTITAPSGDVSLPALTSVVRDLVEAVNELQQLQTPARNVDGDNNPMHGELCEILNGQYLVIVQEQVAGNVQKVVHGLGRKPQGAIFIQHTAANRIYIKGDPLNGIAAATKTEVHFMLNGSVGDTHICILV